MDIKGKAIGTTNAGRPYVTGDDCTFNTCDVARWGLLVQYGRRGYILVADFLGVHVAVHVTKLEKDQRKDMEAVRKMLNVDGAALSSIRHSRDAGIVWDTSGVYAP